MLTNSPLVSIALPVYNGAATLSDAIQSILMQTYKHWELIIIDDASIDNSLDIIRRFDDRRIHIIARETNTGLSACLNLVMDQASGKYFARMDQDDLSYPERIEQQVKYLESHPEVNLLSASIVVFENGGHVSGKVNVAETHEDICRRPWAGFYMAHPTWMGGLEWFRKYRYCSSADGAEDAHLLFRSYQDSCFAGLKTPLLGYRENRLSLKKMVSRRFIFSKVLAHEALKTNQPILAVRIVLGQILKSLGDYLNIILGFQRSRNPLLPLSQQEQKSWFEVWADFGSK